MAPLPTNTTIASCQPALRLPMLLPRRQPKQSGFPFDRPAVHYYYQARNAIYALAQAWKLAGQEVLFPAYFHGVEVETLLAAGVKLRFYPVHKGMRVDPD